MDNYRTLTWLVSSRPVMLAKPFESEIDPVLKLKSESDFKVYSYFSASIGLILVARFDG